MRCNQVTDNLLWDKFASRTELHKQGKDSQELEHAQARKKTLTRELNEHKVTAVKRGIRT